MYCWRRIQINKQNNKNTRNVTKSEREVCFVAGSALVGGWQLAGGGRQDEDEDNDDDDDEEEEVENEPRERKEEEKEKTLLI